MLRDLSSGLVDLLYPPLCLLCQRRLPPEDKLFQVCRSCQNTIVPNRPPFCRKCSRPLNVNDDCFCKSCQKTDLSFDRGWAACLYNHHLRRLIHAFKYGGKTGLRHYFAHLIAGFANEYRLPMKEFDIVLPVPLHPARQRERGFNQALVLAQTLFKNHSPLIRADIVQRRIFTRYQARLSSKERWTNTRQAFKINSKFNIKNRNILIVDDLFTTGATTCAIARLLKRSGAQHIGVLTLAIAPKAHQK